MSWSPSEPFAASSPSELLAGLGATDRLVGYEAILTELIDRYGTGAATACVSASRARGDRRVPSVVLVLEDEVVEGWLSGGDVVTVSAPRPKGPDRPPQSAHRPG